MAEGSASASSSEANKPVSASRSAKMLEQVQQHMKNEEYYEALQGYRALYQRYMAQDKKTEAMELAYKGASKMLDNKQLECAADMAMLLATHLKENLTPLEPKAFEHVCFITMKFDELYRHAEEEPTVDYRAMFVKSALKWTSMVGDEESKYGHPHLHTTIAYSYYFEDNYAKAREHMLYAMMPQTFAEMLIKFSTKKGYKGEADLFIAQAVLQLMVLKRRGEAMRMFKEYTHDHPAFHWRHPPYLHLPLLNFVYYLMIAAKNCKGNSEVFCRLRSEYQHAIARDPIFNEYLDKIGVHYFGMPEPPSQEGSGGIMDLLGNLMSGLSGSHELLSGGAAAAAASASTGPPVVQQQLTPMDTID